VVALDTQIQKSESAMDDYERQLKQLDRDIERAEKDWNYNKKFGNGRYSYDVDIFNKSKTEANKQAAAKEAARARELLQASSDKLVELRNQTVAQRDLLKAEQQRLSAVKYERLKTVDQVRTEQQEAQRQAKEEERRRREIAERAEKERRELEKRIERTDALVRSMAVQSRMSDFIQKVGDRQLAVERMNRIYDESMMGEYMRSKLSTLVNSSSFCQAVKNCGPEKGAPVDLGQLFGKGQAAQQQQTLPEPTPGTGGSAPASPGHVTPGPAPVTPPASNTTGPVGTPQARPRRQ
jgi:hypothetical protein